MATNNGRLAALLQTFDTDELAQKASVHYNTVYRWQAGLRLPRRKHLQAIANATGLAVEDLRAALWADEIARASA